MTICPLCERQAGMLGLVFRVDNQWLCAECAMDSNHPITQMKTTNVTSTWHKTITIDYIEEKWSETCEKYTTTLKFSGVPTIHTDATNVLGLLKDPDKYGTIHKTLERLKALFVPQGQEVTLKEFVNDKDSKFQALTFTTICDHGD